MENVLQIMIDAIKGDTGSYTKGQASEAIRAALVEMNGGSKKINPKNFHRGTEMFDLVQELIPAIIDEGFKDDDAIFALVDYRNIAEGDEQEFEIEANSLFIVADAAKGIRDVRRQRIDKKQTVTVKTSMKMVRVYEDLNRLLAGKVSYDKFVENVAKSFKQQVLADAYAAISALSSSTVGLNSTYVVGGSAFADNALLELVQHVEAATGKKARIYGTKTALMKLNGAQVSEQAKSDLYTMGYYANYYGTDCICMRQAHKAGTDTFALDDKKIFVIADGDQPIKFVNEGEGLLHEGDPFDNADLTQEYVYGQAMGCGVAVGQKLGVYSFT